MRHCHETATTRLFPPSESQPSIKKIKQSSDSPWPSKPKTDIHDLPDFALVEILCRLPHNKFVFQCKSVCKHWSSLISNEKFCSRFLWIQSHTQKLALVESTLIFRDPKDKSAFFMLPEHELPMFKSHNFSLPRLEATDYITTSEDGAIVVGTCNDLVLLCGEVYFQSDYYIWNPYTKQSVCLPPSPRCYREVRVGFFCEPYYKEDQKEESITSSGMIHVEADYRYAIVRICPHEPSYSLSDNFKLEIFSSETRIWTEWLIHSPGEFCLDNMSRNGGTVHGGLLYWLSHDGFIIGLDPFYYSNNTNKTDSPFFHIVDAPYRDLKLFTYDTILSVFGRLRICLFSNATDDAIPSMSIFELKDDYQGGGKWWKLAEDLDLDAMVSENPVINGWRFSPTEPRTLALDPNNEYIVYMELFDHIVVCDIRERKLAATKRTSMFRSMSYFGVCVFPYVLPRWPTPLPLLNF